MSEQIKEEAYKEVIDFITKLASMNQQVIPDNQTLVFTDLAALLTSHFLSKAN